jgi:hypothetical protein
MAGGRPSKLNDDQWQEMCRRSINGETIRSLAREFGISEAAARLKIATMRENLNSVACQIVDTRQALAKLPVSSQVFAQRLADEMMAISMNLAGAGVSGSIVAKTVMEIAAKQVQKVNHDDPMESAEILQGVSALGRIANESSSIGLKMIAVAKESEQPTPTTEDPVQVYIPNNGRD